MVRRSPGSPFPDDRGLVAAPAADVPIQAVHARVEGAADEPLRVRRLPVEHLRPRRDPLELGGKPRPECLRVACGLVVNLRVARVSGGDKRRRRIEVAVLLEERVDLGVLFVGHSLPTLSGLPRRSLGGGGGSSPFGDGGSRLGAGGSRFALGGGGRFAAGGSSPSRSSRGEKSRNVAQPDEPSSPSWEPACLKESAAAPSDRPWRLPPWECQCAHGRRVESMQPGADDLCYSSAVELVRLMRQKQVSARDVMARASGADRARQPEGQRHRHAGRRAGDGRRRTRRREHLPAAGRSGLLHGLPVAHKDLVDTAGIRTTRGSPFYRDYVPTRDALIVTRMRAGGRRSRWARRTRRSSAPGRRRSTRCSARLGIPTTSPGPAAAAAAAPRWRWPAAWCPSPTAATQAARCATRRPSATSSASGRRRAAFRASPRRGRRCRCRVRWRGQRGGRRALPERDCGTGSARSAVAPGRGRSLRRAAWPQLQGRARGVVARTRRDSGSNRKSAGSSTTNRRMFEDLGCSVEEAEPDFAGVDEAFATLRYAANHPRYAPLVRERPDWVKDTIKYEVAEAEKTHRRRHRPRAGATGTDVRPEPRVLRAVRLLRSAGDAGLALRCDDPVPDVDRRHADVVLRRLDALVLVRHVDGEPGDLGARRLHGERASRRRADRRASSRRLERAAARARVRAGDGTRTETARLGLGASRRGGRRPSADRGLAPAARERALASLARGSALRAEWVPRASRSAGRPLRGRGDWPSADGGSRLRREGGMGARFARGGSRLRRDEAHSLRSCGGRLAHARRGSRRRSSRENTLRRVRIIPSSGAAVRLSSRSSSVNSASVM